MPILVEIFTAFFEQHWLVKATVAYAIFTVFVLFLGVNAYHYRGGKDRRF